MRWEEGGAEAEVGCREDGERFYKNVGDCFVFGEVRVKLVPISMIGNYTVS